MRVELLELAEGREVLAGGRAGEAFLPVLLAALHQAQTQEVVELDLSGVGVMTASFFNAGVLPLWEASVDGEWFPVLRCVSETSLGDIELVLRETGMAVWQFDEDDSLKLLGSLDEALERIAVASVSGPVSASMLFAQDSSIRSTAWSNRLAALYSMRLVKRRKRGRKLFYVAPWLEVDDG